MLSADILILINPGIYPNLRRKCLCVRGVGVESYKAHQDYTSEEIGLIALHQNGPLPSTEQK